VLCEVHVVLPKNLDLTQAHDISTYITNALEGETDVSKAYVHIDTFIDHRFSKNGDQEGKGDVFGSSNDLNAMT
ncbi:hypothetical protein KIPB_013041, partial [Kipferlia bialata]